MNRLWIDRLAEHFGYGLLVLGSIYLLLGSWGVLLAIGLAAILTILTGEFEREIRALIEYRRYE